jgi:hypothetical protein
MNKPMTESRLTKLQDTLSVNWNFANLLAAAAIWTDAAGFAMLAYSDRIGWFEDDTPSDSDSGSGGGSTNEITMWGITFPRMDEVLCAWTTIRD